MKKRVTTLAIGTSLALSIALSSPLLAAEKTVKLSVPGMTCASCPYIVKESISMIDGVKKVDATMQDRSATVIYDDEVTNLKEIKEATKNVGYPSKLFTKANQS